jgi:hypothetical protein
VTHRYEPDGATRDAQGLRVWWEGRPAGRADNGLPVCLDCGASEPVLAHVIPGEAPRDWAAEYEAWWLAEHPDYEYEDDEE